MPRDRNQEKELALPNFSFSGIASPLPDRKNIALDIQIQVPYNKIQFVRYNGQYRAEYEIGITFKDKDNTKLGGKILKRELISDSYYETRNENKLDAVTVPFVIPAKNVKAIIRVTDLDTRKTRYLDDTRDYSQFYEKPVVLGDVAIIKQVIKDSTKTRTIFWGNVLPEPLDTLRFQAKLMGSQGPYDIQYRLLHEDEPVYYFTIKIATSTMVDTVLRLKMSTAKMTFGQYSLELSVRDGKGATVASRAKFRVHWRGVSSGIHDLGQAIRQLRYITGSKEIKKMLQAKGDDQRKLFLEFWRVKDPTPTTTQNELMDEYYRRVSYATEHFGGIREGWLTDMGAIYILFGPPDEIDRRPFELDQKPTEIWYYFDINQQFVFVDLTGFGEYRLIEPYSFQHNWEYHP